MKKIISIINHIAPEHIEILSKNYKKYLIISFSSSGVKNTPETLLNLIKSSFYEMPRPDGSGSPVEVCDNA